MDTLEYLGSTYFHQDYDVYAPTPIGVVEKFRDVEYDGTVQDLIGDLDTVINAEMAESELEEIWLRRCGSMYNPTSSGMTFKAWFELMRSVLP